MAATVGADLDAAVAYLAKTTTTWAAMVKRYGADWRKWPTGSNWWRALNALDQARTATPVAVVSSEYGVSQYGGTA